MIEAGESRMVVSNNIINKIMVRYNKVQYAIMKEEAEEYQCIGNQINAYKWHLERVDKYIENAIICKAISKKINFLKYLSEDLLYKFHMDADYLLECYNNGHIQYTNDYVFYGISSIMFSLYSIFPIDINNHISMYISSIFNDSANDSANDYDTDV